uniref:Centrosomal protein 131 n=1 Tax=Sphenodon punctatus TaxID=8508 RepID=A0A8D0HBJ6_SPHPU
MKSTRSSSSFQGANVDGVDLSLTGLPLQVLRRPSSACPAKYIARSISVITESKPKRNPLVTGAQWSEILRRSWDRTSKAMWSLGPDLPGDFLTFFDSSTGGRKKLAGLSKASPEKKTTWNILDDQPRLFPTPSGARETPTGMRKRETSVSLAHNFTANNRSNKGAMGNCVTTMVHNNYSTADKAPAPKSSNKAATSLNNIIKATSNEDTESSSYMKSRKNFSSNNLLTQNNASGAGGPLRRQEVSEEEAESFIHQVNVAAVTIQRWYRRHSQRHKAGAARLGRLLASKREVCVCVSRSPGLTLNPVSLLSSSLLSPQQDVSSGKMASEDMETVVTAASRTQSKITLADLLDTLELLEEQPELLPHPKAGKKDKYAWIHEADSNSLTTDNLERFGKLNCSPGVPAEGALLSEAKLQSIISFLDEMEKSEQERPRSAASSTQREGFLSEEELAHLEQASAVATEVTSSIMRLKLEVEEKKRAIDLLQTELVQQRELTMRHVKETEKELSRQLTLQREQYEAAIQRHLTFIDQLIDDKKVLSEKCEAVVSELKQVDQKYTKKIAQMQEQHELDWCTLGPLCKEIKKLKELMSATEKIRREKWIDEKTKKIKEITVKGLEPEIQKLIARHKQEIKKLKALHEAELLQSDERAAQRYVQQAEELRQLLEREKEEQGRRERELVQQRYEKQLEQEEQTLQQQRRRLYSEVAEEKERLNHLLRLGGLSRERDRPFPVILQERLEIEKQAWEANYLKKEEAWMISRERELREGVRKERDKEIELVIQRLEADMSSAKEECEMAAENRIKRLRDKYEVELLEQDRSERKVQDRCNDLKGRLAEAEGEGIRLQGLLRQKEQELSLPWQARDQLAQERSSLSEVIRQEFADRLVSTEEENKRLKVEMAELRARQRLELDRVARDKSEELEETCWHLPPLTLNHAVLGVVPNPILALFSMQAAVKRADHLEALLDQQRKQLLATK